MLYCVPLYIYLYIDIIYIYIYMIYIIYIHIYIYTCVCVCACVCVCVCACACVCLFVCEFIYTSTFKYIYIYIYIYNRISKAMMVQSLNNKMKCSQQVSLRKFSAAQLSLFWRSQRYKVSRNANIQLKQCQSMIFFISISLFQY